MGTWIRFKNVLLVRMNPTRVPRAMDSNLQERLRRRPDYALLAASEGVAATRFNTDFSGLESRDTAACVAVVLAIFFR
jgi:hypothetical protein